MPEFFTRKIGPLPAWGWGAVAGGGFLLYRWWKNRQAGASTAPAAATSSTDAGSASVPDTSTLTLPGGASYSGSPSGLPAFSQLLGQTASQPTPTAATTPSSPTYTTIADPAVGAALQASGVPIFVGVGGPQGPEVPFKSGVNYPAGSVETYQAMGYSPVSYAPVVSTTPGGAVTGP